MAGGIEPLLPSFRPRGGLVGVLRTVIEIRVGDEERAGRLGPARLGGDRGAEKCQELLTGADRETVGGVGDDVVSAHSSHRWDLDDVSVLLTRPGVKRKAPDGCRG